MADALVSPLIEAVIKKAGSYIRSQYTWRRDMEDDLGKLKRTLLGLHTVVAAAERRQIEDQNQVALLRELKDVVYEADDVLDEFEYRGMEAQAKKARGTVSCIAFSSLRFAKRLVGEDKLRNQLKGVLKNLDDINENARKLINVLMLERENPRGQVESDHSHVTSSILQDTKIFGRDKEKDKIVSLLLDLSSEPESSDRKPIPIIPIIGIGGIGKTTLAQIVYNDERVAHHFHLRMWVCVSNSFDKFKLTREMLESTSRGSNEHRDFENFDVLQEKLQSKLESKRFLLVLDDVWINEKWGDFENKQMWKEVLAPLKAGARDSKILVTSRMENVADMFEEKNLISLEGLDKDEYRQLLTSCAFGNKNPDNYPELRDIADKIATRLKGSPLAAKAVGSLLQRKLDIKEWKKIMETEAFDDITKILRLSYEHLPGHLKCCFAYCSIFPKDWEFEPRKLSFLWMAQGYIQHSSGDGKSMEDIGIDYFNELISRSFFQEVEQGSFVSYTMHDLIHDLAQVVSVDECFRINGGDKCTIERPIRHLGVVVHGSDGPKDLLAKVGSISNLKNLRTLLFFYYGFFRLPSWFKELRSLRVLGFSDAHLDGDIGHLLHLRYLDLGPNEVLAPSMSGLYHLQVLFSSWRLRLPKGMTELINFGKLTNICVGTLDFPVGKRRGRRVGVWTGIRITVHPTVLFVDNLENVHSQEEATEVDLEHREFINTLRLSWGFSKRFRRHDLDAKVLEGLKPHPNLKSLAIEHFRATRSPSWLETDWLINLQSIWLTNCRWWEVLPPLGHLPCLKHLSLSGMQAMKRVGRDFYGDDDDRVKGFPSLEQLTFKDMQAWVEWSAPEFPVFPDLRDLCVEDCPKLMRFPHFPPALKDVVIQHTGLISDLRMHPILSLSSLGSMLSSSAAPDAALSLLHDHHLRAIEMLAVEGCMEPMPARGMSELVSPKQLRIYDCTKLLATKIPGDEVDGRGVLPSSLELLEICKCHVTDGWLSRCLQGLCSLSNLQITDCNGLTSLPSAQVLHRLTALQRLELRVCEELASLGGLHALLSLKHLQVEHCPKLELLPEDGLPASIESLHLLGCHPALAKQMHVKEGPEWDKIARIPRLQQLGFFDEFHPAP